MVVASGMLVDAEQNSQTTTGDVVQFCTVDECKVMTIISSFQQIFGFLSKVYTTTAAFLRHSFFTRKNLSH